ALTLPFRALALPLPALLLERLLPLRLRAGVPGRIAADDRPDRAGQQDRTPGQDHPERPNGTVVPAGEHPDHDEDQRSADPAAPDRPQPRVPAPPGRRLRSHRRGYRRHLRLLRWRDPRQVAQYLVQLAVRACGVGLLQPVDVLAEIEPALVQRLAESIGHVLPVRVGRAHVLPSLRHATSPSTASSLRGWHAGHTGYQVSQAFPAAVLGGGDPDPVG